MPGVLRKVHLFVWMCELKKNVSEKIVFIFSKSSYFNLSLASSKILSKSLVRLPVNGPLRTYATENIQ